MKYIVGFEQEAVDEWKPQLMDELLTCMDNWGLIIGERSSRDGDAWAWEMKDATALIRALRTKQSAASEETKKLLAAAEGIIPFLVRPKRSTSAQWMTSSDAARCAANDKLEEAIAAFRAKHS